MYAVNRGCIQKFHGNGSPHSTLPFLRHFFTEHGNHKCPFTPVNLRMKTLRFKVLGLQRFSRMVEFTPISQNHSFWGRVGVMAAARMCISLANLRVVSLSPLTQTNCMRNGSDVCFGPPVAITSSSLSSTFRFDLALIPNRTDFRFGILARAAELGSQDLGTELERQSVTTEPESHPSLESQAVATEHSDEQVVPGTKLYVGNLPWDYDSTQLAEVCQDIATVETAEVIYDFETGRSRGFAFVTMASIEDAQAVIDVLDGTELGGRILKVNYPKFSRNNPRVVRANLTRGRPGNVNKMFVSNFPWACDAEALMALFSGYGTVVEAKVVYNSETGRSRGYGFVTMETGAEVEAAIAGLNGAEYGGRVLRVVLVEDKKPRSRE